MKIPTDQTTTFASNTRIQISDKELIPLAENMKRLGQINPITVIKTRNGHDVVAGRRRVMASRLLGWDEIEANIIADKSQGELIALSLSENVHRQAMHPMDIADAVNYYCQIEGKTLKEAGALLGGRSVSLLSECQNAAAKLTEGAKQMLEDQGISAHTWVAKLPEQLQLEVANDYVSEKWSRKQLQQKVRELTRKRQQTDPRKDPRITLTLTSLPDYEALIHCLTEAIKTVNIMRKQNVDPDDLPGILSRRLKEAI